MKQLFKLFWENKKMKTKKTGSFQIFIFKKKEKNENKSKIIREN